MGEPTAVPPAVPLASPLTAPYAPPAFVSPPGQPGTRPAAPPGRVHPAVCAVIAAVFLVPGQGLAAAGVYDILRPGRQEWLDGFLLDGIGFPWFMVAMLLTAATAMAATSSGSWMLLARPAGRLGTEARRVSGWAGLTLIAVLPVGLVTAVATAFTQPDVGMGMAAIGGALTLALGLMILCAPLYLVQSRQVQVWGGPPLRPRRWHQVVAGPVRDVWSSVIVVLVAGVFTLTAVGMFGVHGWWALAAAQPMASAVMVLCVAWMPQLRPHRRLILNLGCAVVPAAYILTTLLIKAVLASIALHSL